MAPSFWWGGGRKGSHHHKGTPVVVKMDNPNWSMVELQSPEDKDDDFLSPPTSNINNSSSSSSTTTRRDHHKTRYKNAKQLTWVLLLKAHRAAGCLSSLATFLLSLSSAINRRVRSGRTDSDDLDDDDDPHPSSSSTTTSDESRNENPKLKTRFYTCIKVFLFVSVLLFCFEVAAYFKGWHFGAAPHLQLQYLLATPFGFRDFFDSLYSRWVLFRVEYLAPPLQFLANACIVLFMIQSLDRLILCLGCFWIRFKKIRPIPKTDSLSKDLESGEDGYFPMVLVQIPMCNEREV